MDASLDAVAVAVDGLTRGVRQLQDELVQAENLRDAKVRALRKLLIALVPAIGLLVIMAVTNGILISRTSDIAGQVAGCVRPDTACGQANLQANAALMDKIRETQFVIATCQRLNPVEKDPDASGIQKCVRDYYPTFTLPGKAAK